MNKRLELSGVSPLPDTVIDFISDISNIDEVNRIIIFGSRACGDYEKYSDVDLAIDAEGLGHEGWVKLRERAYYEVRTVLQISVVNYFKNPDRLKNRILENGKIIYEQ